MSTLFRPFVLVSIACVSLPLEAQKRPTLGILYGVQENQSLKYDCAPTRDEQLTCDLVQTSVHLKSTFAELPDVVAKARKQFASEKPPAEKDCSAYRQFADIAAGKATAPKPEAMAKLSRIEIADAGRLSKGFVDYCDKPSEETFVAIARVGHDRERRTCVVRSVAYKRTFRKTSEKVWTAKASPEGVCGVVDLSRFEADETNVGKSTFVNWSFMARKAITNPNAEFLPGGRCGDLDERSYKFDWRDRDVQLTCDYIHFSPL